MNPGCLNFTLSKSGCDFPIWIVSDLRRATDLKFFNETYPNCLTSVRISASDEARIQRGFVYTVGIDDTESECGLDHVTEWDVCIKNEGDLQYLQSDIERLIGICQGS